MKRRAAVGHQQGRLGVPRNRLNEFLGNNPKLCRAILARTASHVQHCPPDGDLLEFDGNLHAH
jgi:hypothetical protein